MTGVQMKSWIDAHQVCNEVYGGNLVVAETSTALLQLRTHLILERYEWFLKLNYDKTQKHKYDPVDTKHTSATNKRVSQMRAPQWFCRELTGHQNRLQKVLCVF